MNDLNTQQIILLCLLVSFVTSIATGITTVSLLEQVPDPVSQTINRVVEKTIERVVTEPGETKVETVIETVIVTEEERVMESVQKNINSVVRLYLNTDGEKGLFVGLGVIVDPSGKVITDSALINVSQSYIASYAGNDIKMKVESDGEKIEAVLVPDQEIAGINFSSAKVTDSSNLKLGQKVVVLSGQNDTNVLTGIIEGFNTTAEGVEPFEVLGIRTSVNSTSVIKGSILLNLSGEIIGFSMGINGGTATFVPSLRISSLGTNQ